MRFLRAYFSPTSLATASSGCEYGRQALYTLSFRTDLDRQNRKLIIMCPIGGI